MSHKQKMYDDSLQWTEEMHFRVLCSLWMNAIRMHKEQHVAHFVQYKLVLASPGWNINWTNIVHSKTQLFDIPMVLC